MEDMADGTVVVEEIQEDVAAVDENDDLWAEKLVAKGRAPVKRNFLVPAPLRSTIGPPDAGNGNAADVVVVDVKEPPKISSQKKSKRQLKRERSQAKKSTENICAAVARTGDANACIFGANCRYNHDLSSYMAQKPPDLPGECPSLSLRKQCRFGIRCRFAGTHSIVGNDEVTTTETLDEETTDDVHGVELNVLNKDFQKSLWKNHVPYPKASSQLQALGLLDTLKDKYLPKGDASRKGEVEAQDVVASETNGHKVPLSKKPKMGTDGLESLSEAGTTGMAESNPTDANNSKKLEPADKSNDDYWESRLNSREKKKIDFKGKLYLAPLTTVGNLPFRRLCKKLGADVTCGEMAMCANLLQGQASEWALLRRHPVEDIFGVQICGSHADTLARTVELIEKQCSVDFIDINLGCPIDIVVNKGAGSCLLTKPTRLEQIVRATAAVMDNPLTLKVRTGYFEGRNCVHSMVSKMSEWGAAAVTIHGRTRQQRYSKLADWAYIYDCAKQAPDDLQIIGNGDVFSFTDWNEHLTSESKLSSCMIARGALIKPWISTEIKEQRHWDISASERLDIIRDYVRFGLEHWGSDSKGVETTRKFLLEWLSYSHRYIPVGLLEIIPPKLNWRPPSYFGRNDLETLMASDSAADWVRISEMLLGPPPPGFVFTPKHKSNAYDKAENG